AKKQCRRNERNDASGYVNKVAVNEVRPEELSHGERDSDDRYRRQHLESLSLADHRANEPEGDYDRSDWKYAAYHRVKVLFRQARHSRERVNGSSNRAPRYGRCVGDQIQCRCVKWLEAQPYQESACDGN